MHIFQTRVIKELAVDIPGPLMCMFSRSWNIKEIPKSREDEKIVSVFKKYKRDDLDNSRLVTLTSSKCLV